MPEQIGERARRAIVEKVFPGCVIGVVRKKGDASVLPFGDLVYKGGERAKETTVYDLASITKSIPTASLAAAFVSEERLTLSDKVAQYIPELQNDHRATIEDLLRYRVKGAALSRLPYKTFEEIRTHIFESGFDGPPGKSVYTNLPAFILGIVLERVSGKSLHALAHEYFFSSLKMENTTFFPSAQVCAPTEIGERGEVRGLPHDESAYTFAVERRSVGHAGLFSNAPDLLKLLGFFLDGRFPHIVEAAENGLGWQLSDASFMGKHAGARTFGKTGFTGTSIVCDTERGIGFVVLSNRTYPKRPPDNLAINVFRCDIADILLQ